MTTDLVKHIKGCSEDMTLFGELEVAKLYWSSIELLDQEQTACGIKEEDGIWMHKANIIIFK